MKFEPLVRPLLKESADLLAQCQSATNPLLTRAAIRLSQVEADELEMAHDRPPFIAIVGGTGVGKSTLFNLLIGKEGASEVSHGKRLCTRHPIVARPAAIAHLMPALDDDQVTWVDATLPRLALIDTPDLDGAREENRRVAEEVIRKADILVYVTIPDKRADHALLEVIRSWSERKRWLFVLNKADTAGDDLPEVRREFIENLRRQGFEPDHHSVFAVSAKQPRDFDLSRLRESICTERSSDTVAILGIDAVLGRVVHATNPQLLDELDSMIEAIGSREQDLRQQLHEHLADGVRALRLERQLSNIVRQRVWHFLPRRAPGPLALPLLLHARLAGLFSAFQLWKLFSRGLSPWRIWSLGASLTSAMRGYLETRVIVQRLDEHLEEPLRVLDSNVQWVLRYYDLPSGTDDDADDAELQKDLEDTTAAIPLVGSSLSRLVRRYMEISRRKSHVVEELAPVVSESVDRHAEGVADRCVRWYHKIWNLPPLVMLCHFSYRIVESWIVGEWLPFSFFMTAIAMFVVSLLPGYLLIWLSVSAACRKIQPMEVILNKSVARHSPSGSIRKLQAALHQLERIRKGLGDLRRRATTIRELITTEWGVSTIGISGMREPAVREVPEGEEGAAHVP